MDTQKAYAEQLVSELATFVDPFSKAELRTELQCYPISFLPHEQTPLFDRDLDDDQLLWASLQKDLPETEQRFNSPVTISDGAAYLFNNRTKLSVVALLGAPGLGKTSLLRKVALLLAQEARSSPTSPVPLLVDLRALAPQLRQTCNMMEFLELCVGQYEEFEAFLRDHWLSKQVALLLDGLEHTDTAQRRICEWVTSLASVYTAPLIVVTSRLTGFCGLHKADLVRVELLPLKLQLNAAQYLLSEMQFERFIEAATGSQTHFSDFASTPMMLGLLLDLFRWGQVGAEKELSWGRLLELALRHVVGAQLPAATWTLLEALGLEVLRSGLKDFTVADLQRLGLKGKWECLSEVGGLFHRLDRGSSSQNLTALPDLSDEDCLPATVDAEEAIGAVRESAFRADKHHREATPLTVSLTHDTLLNYQAARSFIAPTDSEPSEVYRFTHLRLAEVLAARHLHSQVLDLVASASGHFVMESSLYSHAFGTALGDVLFSRVFRETVMIFCSLCSDAVFENFVKFLLGKRKLEYVYLAYRALRERGHFSKFRPLINKMQQLMSASARKQFVQGFCHPCSAIRRLVEEQCIEANVSDTEQTALALKYSERVLSSWVQVRHLKDWCREGSRAVCKVLMKQLASTAVDMVQAAGRHQHVPVNLFTELCALLVRLLDDQGEKSLGASFPSSASSSSLNSPASYSTPNEPARTERPPDIDHTLRITFDRFHMPELQQGPERLSSLEQKTQSYLLEVLVKCEAVDLQLTTRLLYLLHCPRNVVHLSLATRVQTLGTRGDLQSVEAVIRDMGFVTQHTIDMLLESMDSQHSTAASDILRQLNVAKLKSYAVTVITKDSPQDSKVRLALRALAFTCRYEVDEEVVHLLVQFADHYNPVLRLEALNSLCYLLTNCATVAREKTIIHSPAVRRTVAPLPHVLKDRLRLQKYAADLQKASIKLLVALWIALDRAQEDTHWNEMQHVLVPEQQKSSLLVGSLQSLLALLSRLLRSEEVEVRLAVWQSLRSMELAGLTLGADIAERLLHMVKESLADIEESVQLAALKCVKTLSPEIISLEAIKQELKLCLFSSRRVVLREVTKIFYRAQQVEELRRSFPSLMVSCPLDICSALENFAVVAEVIQSKLHIELLDRDIALRFEDAPRDGSNAWQCRALANQFKALVNCVAEGLQAPGSRASLSGHRMELLELSLDPSFIRGDTSDSSEDPEEPRQNSSQNTEVEDSSAPLSLSLCHTLLKAGVRTEPLRQWVLWHLARCTGAASLAQAAACVALLDETVDAQGLETVLLESCLEDADSVATCVVSLNFKSDAVALALIQALRAGSLQTDQTVLAVGKALELRTPQCLELLMDSVDFAHGDAELCKRVQRKSAQVLETLTLSSEAQLRTVLEVLCRRPSSLALQSVWNFLLQQLAGNPAYTLPADCQSLLGSAHTWDGRLLRRWTRRLGLYSAL